MCLNYGVGEDSWESLGLQGDPTSPSLGDQSWVFIGRTDVEAETPIPWPPDAKSWLIGKDPDAGKDWGQEEKGTTEDEIVGWHHRLNGHGFGWTPGVGDGQGGLECCGSWGRKESDTTERLNWTELIRQWLRKVHQTQEVVKEEIVEHEEGRKSNEKDANGGHTPDYPSLELSNRLWWLKQTFKHHLILTAMILKEG